MTTQTECIQPFFFFCLEVEEPVSDDSSDVYDTVLN